ncbi:SH3 and multiple ankyrin repeat domains protein 3-like [Trachypithecus francoisi]|uniref:SH3 and multiple ankyrin repeat domains protein 3-like n=1 Tax=Trachypithecus francoisi TaxID=54180 RepID=UPI00141BDC07|nr:SH3 and multiple ankyrin repeat domains protein 3-like [Trachypithecus francoisi]
MFQTSKPSPWAPTGLTALVNNQTNKSKTPRSRLLNWRRRQAPGETGNVQGPLPAPAALAAVPVFTATAQRSVPDPRGQRLLPPGGLVSSAGPSTGRRGRAPGASVDAAAAPPSEVASREARLPESSGLARCPGPEWRAWASSPP